MSFKYSAFTAMMPEYTHEEAVKLLKKIGFDGIEWRTHTVPSNPNGTDFWNSNKATLDLTTIADKAKDIKKLTQDNDLEVIGLGTYISCKHLDDVQICMDAARTMGSGSVRVSPPKYNGSVHYYDLYQQTLEDFAKIVELAQTYKVRANIEIRPGHICSSPSLAYRIVSKFDPDSIGVIIDPGNMITEGFENWQMAFELLGPYLAFLHIKNTAWIKEKGVGYHWTNSIVPIEEGMANYSEILTALDAVGYSGWLSFEDFSIGSTEEKLKQNLKFFKSLEKSVATVSA